MRRAVRQSLKRAADGVGNRIIPDLARRAGPGFVVKPVHPALGKAAAAFPNRVALRDNLDTDRLVLSPRSRRQDNTRPPRHGLSDLVSAGQGFQFSTLGLTQDNFRRYTTHDPLPNHPCDSRNFKIRILGSVDNHFEAMRVATRNQLAA
jgi:hypothetical protein